MVEVCRDCVRNPGCSLDEMMRHVFRAKVVALAWSMTAINNDARGRRSK